jgi:hypothetical protein
VSAGVEDPAERREGFGTQLRRLAAMPLSHARRPSFDHSGAKLAGELAQEATTWDRDGKPLDTSS